MSGVAQAGAVANAVADTVGADEIKKRLKEWIVFHLDGTAEGGQGGVLPIPAPLDDAGEPVPDEKKGHFAKIRIPGGYTFVNALGGNGIDLNKDTTHARYNVLDFGKEIFDVEEEFVKDNPALHKIPLVALVEKQDPGSGEWGPAPAGVSVYFQLVPPYAELPNFKDAQKVTVQANRPPLRNLSIGPNWGVGDKATSGTGTDFGPKGYSKQKDPSDPDSTLYTPAKNNLKNNPQALNCPKDHGGKNGKGNLNDCTDVADVIFSVQETDGFNKAPCKTHKPYPKAEKATPVGDKHKHAVKAKTNEDGEAGVIFMPSRCAGDRYRIRAYVGPDTLTGAGSDGTGISAVLVETGTFVVWRNIRISRYVKQKAGNPPAELRDAETVADYRWKFCFHDASAHAADKTLPKFDLGLMTNVTAPKVGELKGPFDRAGPQFARAFCEVDLDPGAEEEMSLDDWKAAVKQAVDDMKANQASLGLTLDVDKLFYSDKIADGTINQENCLVHLPMRTIIKYNTGLPAGRRITGVQNQRGKVQSLTTTYGWAGFLRYVTKNGYLPGLTVLQAGFGCTWQGLPKTGGGTLIPGWGGMATEYRGAFDWFGGRPYPNTIWLNDGDRGAADVGRTSPTYSYDYTSTVCHELGHLLYRVHAPGKNALNRSEGGGKDPKLHDPLAKCICVMAYKKCEGQFCAKCLFAFRGWKLANLTDHTP